MGRSVVAEAAGLAGAKLRQIHSGLQALSWLQRLAATVSIGGAVLFAFLVVTFGSDILVWLTPLADSWREHDQAWLIIWVLAFAVAIPPFVGFSSLLAVCGFVYGMYGWFIIATATVTGSTASFLLARHVWPSFGRRLVTHDRHLTVLSRSKYDSIGAVILLRLCPLPYSVANGAIATFPEVTWVRFAIGSAVATAKHAIYVFAAWRLAAIGRFDEDSQDPWDKTVAWILFYFSLALGFAVGLVAYRQALRRAADYSSSTAQSAAERDPEYAYLKEDEFLQGADDDDGRAGEKDLDSLVADDSDDDDGTSHTLADGSQRSATPPPKSPINLEADKRAPSPGKDGLRHGFKRQGSEYYTEEQ